MQNLRSHPRLTAEESECSPDPRVFLRAGMFEKPSPFHPRPSCRHRLKPVSKSGERDVATKQPGAFTSHPPSTLPVAARHGLAVFDQNRIGSSGSLIICELGNTQWGHVKKEEKVLLESLVKECLWFMLQIP